MTFIAPIRDFLLSNTEALFQEQARVGFFMIDGRVGSPRHEGLSSGLVGGGLLLVLLAILYMFFPLINHTEGEDALYFALRVRDGNPVAHPNHLLFEPLLYVLHRTAVTLFGPIDALRFIQSVNTLFALIALCLASLLVRRRQGAEMSGIAALGIIGLSVGFWSYAIEADTYLPPLTLALMSVLLLDGTRPPDSDAEEAAPPLMAVIAAALATALAVLLHQMYVFFALATGLALLIKSPGSKAVRWQRFLLFGSVSGVIVLIAYFAAFAISDIDASRSFLNWASGRAHNGLWDPPSLATPLKGLVGLGTSILSLNVLFAFDSFSALIESAFPGKLLIEERYLADAYFSSAGAVAIILAMFVAGIALLYLAVQTLLVVSERRNTQATRFVDQVLAANIMVLVPIVLLWEASNREFWIPIFAFLTLYAIRRLDWRAGHCRAAALLLLPALFITNFFGLVRPASMPMTDYWMHANRPLIERVGSFDIVLTECGYICTGYIRYFARADVVSPSQLTPEELGALIASSDKDRLLVSSWAFSPHLAANLPASQQVNPAIGDYLQAPKAEEDGAIQRLYRIDGRQLVPVD